MHFEKSAICFNYFITKFGWIKRKLQKYFNNILDQSSSGLRDAHPEDVEKTEVEKDWHEILGIEK